MLKQLAGQSISRLLENFLNGLIVYVIYQEQHDKYLLVYCAHQMWGFTAFLCLYNFCTIAYLSVLDWDIVRAIIL